MVVLSTKLNPLSNSSKVGKMWPWNLFTKPPLHCTCDFADWQRNPTLGHALEYLCCLGSLYEVLILREVVMTDWSLAVCASWHDVLWTICSLRVSTTRIGKERNASMEVFVGKTGIAPNARGATECFCILHVWPGVKVHWVSELQSRVMCLTWCTTLGLSR